MFDEDLMFHIINYINDYPSDIRLDDYREETRIIVTGRMGAVKNWGSAQNDFSLNFNYDKAGNLKNVNGMEFTFDTTPLRDAFKKAIARNFKIKRKMDRLTKKGKK